MHASTPPPIQAPFVTTPAFTSIHIPIPSSSRSMGIKEAATFRSPTSKSSQKETRSRSPVTRSQPTQQPKQPRAEPQTPTTPRTKRRVSEFASKKPSAKKRKRETTGPVADVEQLLHGVPELVKAEHSKQASELRSALKRAKEAFQYDESGSSSSEEAGMDEVRKGSKRGNEGKEGKNRRGKAKEGEIVEDGNFSGARPQRNVIRDESTPKRPGGDSLVTPTKSRPESAKKGKLSAKRAHLLEESAMKAGPKSKTASALKRDIEALKKDDPEFYKFLEENDATLLDFDLEDDLVGFSDEEDKTKENSEHDHDGDRNMQKQETIKNSSEVDNSKLEELVNDRVKPSADEKKSNDVEEDEEGTKVLKESDIDLRSDSNESGNSIERGKEDIEIAEVMPTKEENVGLAKSNAQLKSINTMGDEEDGAPAEPNSDEEDEDSDEERELLEERQAAAEAGLDLDGNEMEAGSDEDTEGLDNERPTLKDKEKKTIVVDTAYLRGIKEKLESSRACLKAAKDLLRLLRAGRDLLPSQTKAKDKKAKTKKAKAKGRDEDGDQFERDAVDVDEDEFADDGSFTSGKVKFVTSKAYQNAMNLAITGVQDALDHMLGRPDSKKDPSETHLRKWDPTASSRWPNLQPVFRPYVFHMLALCDTMNDPNTLRFLLKRLERLALYTRDNELLLKKIIRVAVRVWSSDSIHMSNATKLRAYLLLSKLAHCPGNAEAVLRSCCTVFSSQIANVCNPRTLPRIQFAVTCITELFGVEMGSSYTTAFASLREMAVSLRAVLVAKNEKDEIDRIHNWSYINQLRLWSQVLSKHGGEDELQPLIYPYVQISLGVIRVHATPKTFPMRLHVASYLSDLVAATGTFIPLTPHLLQLLRCSELRKKPERGRAKALEWRSLLRVSDDVIKTKPFLSGVVHGVVFQLAKFFSIISRHVSFPELSHVVQTTLRRFAKEVVVPEWKTKVMTLVEKLHQTSEIIANARTKADFSPHGAVSPEGMLGVVPGLDCDKQTPIQRFYEIEQARVGKEEKIRDETSVSKETDPGKREKKVSIKIERIDSSNRNGQQKDTKDLTNSFNGDDSDLDARALAENATKKGNASGKGLRRKQVPSLSVPQVSDDDDEDVVEDLILESDESDDD